MAKAIYEPVQLYMNLCSFFASFELAKKLKKFGHPDAERVQREADEQEWPDMSLLNSDDKKQAADSAGHLADATLEMTYGIRDKGPEATNG